MDTTDNASAEESARVKIPRTLPPKIAAALVAAQRTTGAVGKDSENTHHRYKYTSAEALMLAATEALGASGLAFLNLGWELDEGLVETSWVLVHESGETLGPIEACMPALPGNGRPMDKAISTALTYLQGYMLRGLLNIPRVDEDEDADRRNDRDLERGRSAQTSRRKRKAKPKPKPPARKPGAPGEDTPPGLRDSFGEKVRRMRELDEKIGGQVRPWVEVLGEVLGGAWPDAPNVDQVKRAHSRLVDWIDETEARLSAEFDEVSDPTVGGEEAGQ